MIRPAKIKMKNMCVILSKFPSPGNVKTRLGKSIGKENAAELAKSLLLDLIDNNINKSYDLSIDTNDAKYLNAFKQLVFPVPVKVIQGIHLRGTNSALLNSFVYHLQFYQKVIAICADTPMIDGPLVEQAFHFLNYYDIVIGSDSGPGYYLIGMSKVHDLFSPIKETKTKRRPYYERTIKLIKVLGLSYKIVEARLDIDTIDDLRNIQFLIEKDNRWTRTIQFLNKLNFK